MKASFSHEYKTSPPTPLLKEEGSNGNCLLKKKKTLRKLFILPSPR